MDYRPWGKGMTITQTTGKQATGLQETANPVAGDDGGGEVESAADGVEPNSEVVPSDVHDTAVPRWPGGSLKWIICSVVLLLIAILAQVVLVVRGDVISGRDLHREQMTVLAGKLVRQAGQAVSGDAGAFSELAQTGESLGQQLAALEVQGNDIHGKISALMRPDFTGVQAAWKPLDVELQDLLKTAEPVAAVYQAAAVVNDLSASMLARSDELVEAVSRESGNADRVNDFSRLRGLGQTIALEVNQVIVGGEIGAVAASQLPKGLRFFEVSLEEIRGSSNAVALARLEALEDVFNEYESAVEQVAGYAPDLFSARSNLAGLSAASERLIGTLGAMNVSGIANPGMEAFVGRLPSIFLLCALLCMWLAARSVRAHLDERAAHALATRHEAESTSQQESILKLLDEISALADGDLTIKAEVTDQVTGSIADSINFAVEEMRSLVRQINMASIQVADGAYEAVQNARFLSDSNTQQSEEISRAAEKMEDVAASMREMSKFAINSASVASESASVAKEGTEAVRGAIKGLDDMRDQIQETSKRIKRLGESLQQIGEIVQLIDDIAEQTNILSLNAAIQASLAGDAGRGFAVVADEVQRLAERSTNATGKIADLVQTIQSDTSDAILSMELATQEVVAGTRIADTAGKALGRIENASDRLTGLIADMAEQAAREARVVTGVSAQVARVRDQSTTTAENAHSAAEAVNKLTELARELEQSVARFRLPNE